MFCSAALSLKQFTALCFVLLVLWPLNGWSQTAALTQQAAMRLEPGRPIERELALDQEHIFRLRLEAGQCARIEVEQRGVNLVLNLLAPDEKMIFWMDDEWGYEGTEQALLIAPVSSEYTLLIGPRITSPVAPKPGKYEVRLTEVRQATEQDQQRYRTQLLYSDATGKIYTGRDEKEKAQGAAMAQEWLRLPRTQGDEKLRANLLWILAVDYFYSLTFAYKQSNDYLREAAELYRQIGNQPQLGRSLHLLAFNHKTMGEFSTAVSYEQQALTVWRESGDRSQEVGALEMLGEFTASLGNDEQALAYYEQAVQIAHEINDPVTEAAALTSLGSFYGWMRDPEKAIECKQRAIRLAQAAGNKLLEARLLDQLTDELAVQQGFYNRSALLRARSSLAPRIVEMLERSRALLRELNYEIEAGPLTTLAGWYAIQGDRRAALEAIERVTKLTESWSPNAKAGIKTYLTFAWGELGDEQKVFELTEQAQW